MMNFGSGFRTIAPKIFNLHTQVLFWRYLVRMLTGKKDMEGVTFRVAKVPLKRVPTKGMDVFQRICMNNNL
jgi:hypothetical protein